MTKYIDIANNKWTTPIDFVQNVRVERKAHLDQLFYVANHIARYFYALNPYIPLGSDIVCGDGKTVKKTCWLYNCVNHFVAYLDSKPQQYEEPLTAAQHVIVNAIAPHEQTLERLIRESLGILDHIIISVDDEGVDRIRIAGYANQERFILLTNELANVTQRILDNVTRRALISQ